MVIIGPSTLQSSFSSLRFSSLPKLKEFVSEKQLDNDHVLHETVSNPLNGYAADFFDDDIQQQCHDLTTI